MSKSPGLYNFNLDFSSVNNYSYMRKCGVFMETRTAIIEEYKKLVISEKRANVSISEICKNVGISRKTFYNYFRDRWDIVEQIILNDIEKPILLGNAEKLPYHDTTYIIFERFLFEKNFYKIVITENCQNSLFESLIECFAKIISHCYDKPGLTESEAKYVDYKEASNIVMLLRKWAKDGMTEPIESMVKVCMYSNISAKR
ncbi:MAG: TetR/AcrR family transcriptional regulator [Ruminococcaceae bacterium]|nr:TetR/AcrR family transcriptional regulator [Oscillospiraceae bacterium]